MFELTQDHRRAYRRHLGAVLRPPPPESVTDWCAGHVTVPPPQTQHPGKLRIIGREYMREPLDLFGNPAVHDVVLCFGSQTGKTTVFLGGVAWCIANDPCGLLWVMPSIDLARSFSETRFLPIIRASEDLAALIPRGVDRHDFKKLQQTFGAALVNFIGSNSPANLASRPARRVILDEVDKFDAGGGGEADAVNLAEQRTKSFAYPQRWKSSTPTETDGLIWQEFTKGDQRRYFVPCPACGRHVLFAWSASFTTFNLTGNEAWIVWDKEAKQPGGWDLDRVERSAVAVCPHCAHRITDDQKTLAIRAGEWRPTATAERHFRSYHLPSLYACTPQTTFGALAVKFLQAKLSLQGLQGFINGDLAEPWENQEARSQRVELVVAPDAPGHGNEPVDFLTADHQITGPKLWWVARRWWLGDSRMMKWGTANSWEELREVQIGLGIDDNHVVIDSKDETQQVCDACLAWGKLVRLPNEVPMWVGWYPAMGMPRPSKWPDKKTGHMKLWHMGRSTLSHARFTLPRLLFNGPELKDILARLREGKTRWKWELIQGADETYYRHLDGEVKRGRPVGRRVVFEWEMRSSRWPNHLLDCEVMQIAMALFHRRLPWTEQINDPKPTHERTDNPTA